MQLLERHGPLTKAALKKKLPRAAQSLVDRTLDELCQAGRVWKHPRRGRREPYGLAPPELQEYLRPAVENLVGAFQKQGFAPGSIWAALRAFLWEAGKQAIRDAMLHLNPHAVRGALVYLPDLRKAVRSYFSDTLSFNQAVLRLAEQGKVQLQSHDRPAQLTPEERKRMVPNRWGSYFMAIGLRLE
ncbi:MAG: hypothetical protein KatS3mg131_2525 [Candidatus Tectimicrobiota bacterium]|nr:MAG: hypothetical protein KatS3mg131_2525 [Candidatus Tectomicrobia bacterium]